MKEQRCTLEEIKQQLDFLDDSLSQASKENSSEIDLLSKQIEQLKGHLLQLENTMTNLGIGDNSLIKEKYFYSVTLIHSLMLYIDEIIVLIQS